MMKTINQTFPFIGTKKNARWIHRAMNYRFNMLMGSIRGSKDYTAIIPFIENVKKSSHDLHLIGAVDIKNAMRIVGRYILLYLGGLAKRTLYMSAPAITFPYNGQTKVIIFAGGKNQGSDDAIAGLTVHHVYFTEINLLNPEFINQAIKRTSTFKDAKIFGTFNPKGKRHWFKENFLELWQKYQDEHPEKKWLNFETFTLYDNPSLDEEAIDIIKASYDPNSTSYKRDILAIESDPENNIFKLNDYNKLNSWKPQDYFKYSVWMDLGESISATVFTLFAVHNNKELKRNEIHALKGYFHINNEYNDIMKLSPLDYINEYVKFIKECIEIFGYAPRMIFYDGTSQTQRDLRRELNRNYLGNIEVSSVDHLKDTDEERIRRIESALYKGTFKFDINIEHMEDDIRNAELDRKTYDKSGIIKIKEEYTRAGHLENLDLLAYATNYYVKIDDLK